MITTDRILEGLARTLEESVLPSLSSGFARGQLHAVLEVLGGLRGQLEWGGLLLRGEAEALRALAAEAAGHAGGDLAARLRAYAEDEATDLLENLAKGRSLVCELIESGAADSGPVASAVDSWLANDAIRKAMALGPSRLAEISEG